MCVGLAVGLRWGLPANATSAGLTGRDNFGWNLLNLFSGPFVELFFAGHTSFYVNQIKVEIIQFTGIDITISYLATYLGLKHYGPLSLIKSSLGTEEELNIETMSTSDVLPPSKGKVLLTGKAGFVVCDASSSSLTSSIHLGGTGFIASHVLDSLLDHG